MGEDNIEKLKRVPMVPWYFTRSKSPDVLYLNNDVVGNSLDWERLKVGLPETA
jgi:hypothetical protein